MGGGRDKMRGVRRFITNEYSNQHGENLSVLSDYEFLLGAAAPSAHNLAPPLVVDAL